MSGPIINFALTSKILIKSSFPWCAEGMITYLLGVWVNNLLVDKVVAYMQKHVVLERAGVFHNRRADAYESARKEPLYHVLAQEFSNVRRQPQTKAVKRKPFCFSGVLSLIS